MQNYKFRRQYPYGKYVLDFVCLKAKLVIEVDGGSIRDELTMIFNGHCGLSIRVFKC